MDDKKPYLSPTQLDMYSTCGEAYRRRYIEGDKIPPGVAALRGRGVHGGAEVNHRQKLTTRQDMSKADIVDAAVTAFETARADGFELTSEERSRGTDIVLGETKDATVRLTSLYAAELAPTIQPAIVEERIRITLPGTHDMLGIIDVATEDHVIHDLKSSAKSKNQNDADSSLQLTMYDMSYRAMTGTAPTGIVLDNLVDTKTPKLVQLRTSRSRADMSALVNRFNFTTAAIQAGVFPPANVGHWRCSERWCGYFSSCRYVNSERKAATHE